MTATIGEAMAVRDLRSGEWLERAAARRHLWLTQGMLVVGAIVVYFGVRTLTEGSPSTATRNADRIIDLEQRLGIHVESAMQAYVLDRDGLAKAANWVYIWGHWPVIIAVLVWLAVRMPDRFTLYRNAMLVSGLVGLVIFATFPVAPPRLLDVGLIDTVTQQSHAYRVLQPPSLVNQYAAMPSFHAGWDLLMGIALVREGRRVWVRVLGCLLPLAMALSVVVTANHYLLDVAVGATIVVGALAFAAWLPGRLRTLRSGAAKDKAMSLCGRPPQAAKLEASPHLSGVSDAVALHAICNRRADVSAPAARPPVDVGTATRDPVAAKLPRAG
jgi:membrane-associated phospholipid phosphatase